MTEPARRLRRADELQLRVVLAALRRGGRFVIVVADEETWPEVRGVLERDLTPPPLHEFRPFDGNDVIEIFSSSEADLEGVIILHVGSEATGAVEALNLHRDKLRQKRSQFILRLDGAAAHERFVRVAPDCYSFRDAVVIIETYPAIVPIQRDNERLEMLRREVAEAKVPGRLRRVARDLIALAQYEEARRALEKEIGLLGAGFWLSPEERLELAGIDYDLSLCTVDEERRRHVVDALRTLEPVRDLYHGEYAAFLRGLCDGYGTDPDAVREALTILQQAGAHRSRPMMATLTNLARALAARDDVKGAREVLAQISDPWWGSSYNNEFVAELSEFLVLIKEGRWEWCERRLRETLAASAQVKDEHWFTFYALALAHLLTMRAEFGAALDVLDIITSQDAELLRALIRCSQGNSKYISGLGMPLMDRPPGTYRLSQMLNEVGAKASMSRRAISAGLLDPIRSERLDDELQLLAAHVAAVAPVDPPWSRINAELLCADNLLARSGAEEIACTATQRALDLARAGAQELIPRCVRRIAVAALRTGAMDGLADLLDEAFAAAEARHLPGEAARLAALRLWHLARLGQDTTEAEQALNAAIDRTGSVLVEAEVLYQAGRGTGRRDLLERSRRIYRSLPWPEREGECLEALGMKAAARTRYETFGLRLAALALDRRTEPPPIVA